MTISHDVSHRGWPQGSSHGAACLEDKFEVLREIGDGSFGTVSVARVRSSGAHVARRGTLVCLNVSVRISGDYLLTIQSGCCQDHEEDI